MTLAARAGGGALILLQALRKVAEGYNERAKIRQWAVTIEAAIEQDRLDLEELMRFYDENSDDMSSDVRQQYLIGMLQICGKKRKLLERAETRLLEGNFNAQLFE